MTRWAERERREGQVCREVYLSKEVVVQEKDASEAQEDTKHHSNIRATCRHAALLEEALIRRAGDTPREHHLPSPPPLHTQKNTPPARTCTHTSAHIRICVWRAGDTRREHHPPTHTHTDALKFGLRSERRGEG